MIVTDQQEVLAFLSTPTAYPPAVVDASPACGAPADPAGSGSPGDTFERIDAVERIDTHSATVFLIGGHAYKLKRAVRYDYLDFSTLEARRRFCHAEVALNRRTAPGLYLGVVPVTREADGGLALGGVGSPVEWLVHMRRFADHQLLDRVAARGALDVALMPPLARAIARLHGGAARCGRRAGADAMRWVVDGNARGLLEEGQGLLDVEACRRLIEDTETVLARQSARLDARARDGWMRACHGDLHLGNIVLIADEPVLFDAVEFNEDLSCIDVLYDVAFLLMDLWRLHLRRHANALLNTYVGETLTADRCDALALLPLFLSCRSAIRAKTSATASRLQPDRAHAEPLARAARAYLEEAASSLRPVPPALIAIGGLSGTGKSTLARAIAPGLGVIPGALVLRSDVARKRLLGAAETDRLAADAYTPEWNARVYAELRSWARHTVRAGHSVVVDAVFGDDGERRAMEAVATEAGAAWAGLWLHAPAAERHHRVAARRRDASDATVEVVAQQATHDVGEVRWPRVEASGPPDVVAQRARDALRRVL